MPDRFRSDLVFEPDQTPGRRSAPDGSRQAHRHRKLLPTAVQVWEDADAERRKLLRGVGPMMFGLCVSHWAKLEAMWANQEGSVTGDRGVRQMGTDKLKSRKDRPFKRRPSSEGIRHFRSGHAEMA